MASSTGVWVDGASVLPTVPPPAWVDGRSGTLPITMGETGPTGQFAPPIEDVTDGNWTNESASNVNLYASIDEAYASLNDTDYIESGATPDNDTVRLKLAPIYSPDAGTWKIWIRARWVR